MPHTNINSNEFKVNVKKKYKQNCLGKHLDDYSLLMI